ncbi:DUF721 domain-containing protein [Pirellulaceae bacterium SH449]
MSAESDKEAMYLNQIPKPMPSRLRPKSVSSILDRVMMERGYAAQQSRQLMEEEWSQAAGEFLASQSKIGQIKRGQLHVFASNDIVRSELEYQKVKILRHMQEALPDMKIQGLRIYLAKN